MPPFLRGRWPLTLTSGTVLLLASACADSTTTEPDAGVTACEAPTGPGTDHSGYPASDETWTAAAGPHRITGDLHISSGVTITIEACAKVQLAERVSVDVGGKLVTRGAAGREVVFERLDAAKAWAQLTATRTAVRPAIELHHTRLTGGGDVTESSIERAHAILVRGDEGGPMLLVDHVEVSGSQTSGVGLLEQATFAAGSTGLTVKGSQGAPVVMTGYALTNLPDGDYSGNGIDALLVSTTWLGRPDQDLEIVARSRGTPYRIGVYGDTAILAIGARTGTSLTTLRFEPGVEWRFQKDFGLEISDVEDRSSGSIVAEGTAALPVVFSSAEATPAAGDWRGILFTAPPAEGTVLDHVVLRYAGSLATETNGYSCGTPPAAQPNAIVGALMFASNRPVTRQILTNSTIEDSGSNGVDRGWTGAEVDYLATNTFTRVAYCTETAPRPETGLCPDPAPCPRE